MKFQPDQMDGVNVISRLEAGRLWVHQAPYTTSVLVPWQGDVQAWPVERVSALQASHFAQLLPMQPELVIFGSGERQQFISPTLYRALIERRIGIDTMDTAAACRTYNVLVNEGRKVVAALLLNPSSALAPHK
ncbi:MAG: Mth938-like domain-containing protein [Burkholderiales bacterium]|nr:Mth938-like domain-containing protein [Burkholderiales bacterium]MBP6676042.1 Mth938-like domain-containing protein [Vitreoscilla sp.]